MFPSYLLNKGLKIKKEEKKSNIAFGKGPVCQLRYSLHQQHMILTKCTHFISRHFLDMMHGRLNCHTVAPLLIITHRRLLFDKFREVSSFYRNSMFFLRKCVKVIWKFSMRAWKHEWKNMHENHAANAWNLAGLHI